MRQSENLNERRVEINRAFSTQNSFDHFRLDRLIFKNLGLYGNRCCLQPQRLPHVFYLVLKTGVWGFYVQSNFSVLREEQPESLRHHFDTVRDLVDTPVILNFKTENQTKVWADSL